MEQSSAFPLNRAQGLVLQGGGALGSFELGVARVIYGSGTGCRFRPGIISGVSIGAISAALLGRPKNMTPLHALESFWNKVTAYQLFPTSVQPYLSVFGTPHFYSFDPFWATKTSFYSVDPLRETLKDLVDVKALADPAAEPRLLLTATDVEAGELKSFKSEDGGMTLDHILASGSLPPSFPMTKIGEKSYWDGGVFDNTPLGGVIDMLDGDAPERAICVVNLFPNQMSLPKNMGDVGQHFLNLLFVNKTKSDLKLMGRFNLVADLMRELDALPDESPVKALDSYKAMVADKHYRRVPTIIEITRESKAKSMEASDFSHAGIEARAAEGRAKAEAAFKSNKLL